MDSIELHLPDLKRSVSSLYSILRSMGFESDIIDRVFLYSQSENIDELLNYLIKGENGWEHQFIPSENDDSICLICDDLSSEHFLLPSESSPLHSLVLLRKQSSSMASSLLQIINEPIRPCPICYLEMEASWGHPECEHYFCLRCIEEYLATKISESDVLNIKCPWVGCGAEFTDELLSNILSSDQFSRYKKFQRRKELLQDPTVRLCISTDCEGFMKGSEEAPQMDCHICEFSMCFKCGERWHSGRCEDAIDKEYEKWARGREVQLCPNCKRRVEKADGCNHMTCSVCSYQWCWLCRGKYSKNHFNLLNPLGCPDLQGGDHTRAQWPLYKIWLWRVCACVTWLLCFPLVLLCIPAFMVSKECYDNTLDIDNQCCLWLVTGLICLGAFLITPAALVIAVPVLIVFGIYRCCKRCKQGYW